MQVAEDKRKFRITLTPRCQRPIPAAMLKAGMDIDCCGPCLRVNSVCPLEEPSEPTIPALYAAMDAQYEAEVVYHA